MQDPGATLYRRRKMAFALLVGATVLLALGVMVAHAIATLAPLIGALD